MVHPSMPSVGEPCARKTIFVGLRTAALAHWGPETFEEIGARLSDECRRDTHSAVVISSMWVPERYLLEWYDAAWEGPCKRQTQAFCEFVDRVVDEGFGRVRKFLLGMATPTMLIKKSPELWQHDHTHPGEMGAEILAPQSARITLSDHVYTTTPRARLAVAEIYRYALSLTRARGVTMAHTVESDGRLAVTLRWS